MRSISPGMVGSNLHLNGAKKVQDGGVSIMVEYTLQQVGVNKIQILFSNVFSENAE
jgi:hypothetical protein